MRTLVTGGAGFIGSHLAERLLTDGHEVSVLDDLSTGRHENVAHLADRPGFRFVEGSVLDRPLVEALIAPVDAVYHLAAAVGVRRILAHPRHAIEVNLQGTECVLAAAAPRGCRVLVASTSEVYGKNDAPGLREGDDSILGATSVSRWCYAATKAVDEHLALAYARECGLPVVIVRLFNTIGPRQTGQYGMVVPRFVQQALHGEPLTIFGDGAQTRCFTDVSDAVSAMCALMANSATAGEVFNVGQPGEISMAALARRVRDLCGSTSPLVFVPYEQAYGAGYEDMRRRVPDVSKLQRYTGFVPAISLADSLARIIAHSRAALR